MNNAIRQFFACYFHQDWNLEFENYTAAIIEYCKDASEEDLIAVENFVDQFITNGNTDEFDIRNYGGFYLPEADGISNLELLKTIKSEIIKRRKIS